MSAETIALNPDQLNVLKQEGYIDNPSSLREKLHEHRGVVAAVLAAAGLVGVGDMILSNSADHPAHNAANPTVLATPAPAVHPAAKPKAAKHTLAPSSPHLNTKTPGKAATAPFPATSPAAPNAAPVA